MADTPLFQLRSVSYQAGGKTILSDLDLEIQSKRMIVLLGPSGAGKSSLLRMFNGLTSPTSGEILFQGNHIGSIDLLHLRQKVGLLFQTPAIFDGSIRTNLLLAGKWNKTIANLDPKHQSAALSQVGLDPTRLDDSARDLSGGEKQRLALARTLLNDPEVLLLDEPTAHLDPRRTADILQLISRLQKDLDLSVIIVTHQLDVIQEQIDDLIILSSGRLKARGPVTDFMENDQLDLHQYYHMEDDGQ